MGWTDADTKFVLSLLSMNTVSPMESGQPSDQTAALQSIAEYAVEAGLSVGLFEPPPASALDDPALPQSVRVAAQAGPAQFLAGQPNLLLRSGVPHSHSRTIMFNAHVDTVGGAVPVGFDGSVISGRGAIDAKGLLVAIIVGLREAMQRRPDLERHVGVLVQCVGGEEGGAMGFYGTRQLIREGHFGRLNVFAEPTDMRFFDQCTAAMTAKIEVEGVGSTDDAPHLGHNATILLSAIACSFARLVAPAVEALGAKICIAGLHTGSMHNRVYGSGSLLINLAYGSAEIARRVEAIVEDGFRDALRDFEASFSGFSLFERTARDVRSIANLCWLKKGLPVLSNRDDGMEQVLRSVGIERITDPGQAFTCDAIWAPPGSYTVVLGPGDLGRNGAHSTFEHVPLSALTDYSEKIADLVLAFAKHIESDVFFPVSADA